MSMNSSEEIEFLLSLQLFTIHCVSNQSSSKIESYCNRLLSAVKNLPKIYIGHKIQIALAFDSASQRNNRKSKLNNHMNIISHLISLSRPDFHSNEEHICKQWTNIDLTQLLDSCEQRFKEQTFSTALWCQIKNEKSLINIPMNYFEKISFDYLQHDTDIQQVFQWIHLNQIHIQGRFNRTYTGIPLLWTTSFQSSQSQSKYGSIRLVFPFSLVYSNEKHRIFHLGTRKNQSNIWNNILITKRKQIAGYGIDFPQISSIFSSPVDIAIDLTDGPLILSNVKILFVDHTDQCIPLLPQQLTSNHSCYHTSHTARRAFIHYLHQNTTLTLDQLKHFFDSDLFEQLKQIDHLQM